MSIGEFAEEFYNRHYSQFDNIEEIKKQLFPPELENTDKLTFKLYFAEPTEEIKSRKNQVPTNISSKITKKMVDLAITTRMVGAYGLTHAAFQIADKIVHFYDTSFVKIDKFKGSNALLLVYASPEGQIPKTPQVLDTIAEVIRFWNVTAVYDERFKNCQDFVEDMISKLNSKCHLKLDLELKFNSVLEKYLTNLVNDPNKGKFALPALNSNGFSKVFITHKELDIWHQENETSLSIEETNLLKAFHRAYQLRYEATLSAIQKGSTEELQKNLSRYSPHESVCFVGNPTAI